MKIKVGHLKWYITKWDKKNKSKKEVGQMYNMNNEDYVNQQELKMFNKCMLEMSKQNVIKKIIDIDEIVNSNVSIDEKRARLMNIKNEILSE